jgi:hypothetical protein
MHFLHSTVVAAAAYLLAYALPAVTAGTIYKEMYANVSAVDSCSYSATCSVNGITG